MTVDEGFDVAEFRAKVANLASNDAVRAAVFGLLSFALTKADRVKGGEAAEGSFLYQINYKNDRRTLISVDAYGFVRVMLGNFNDHKRSVPQILTQKLSDSLALIHGFGSFGKPAPFRPQFEIRNTLVDPSVMTQFQIAILTFQTAVQAL